MKSFMTKFASYLLVFAITLSFSTTALAAGPRSEVPIASSEDIKVTQDAYKNLTPDAKIIFERAISNDPELLAFHKAHVDPYFAPFFIYSRAVAADPLSILRRELMLIGLPIAVVYAFEAMGAGMVAAVADGVLPIGDILLVAASVSAAVVVAANWKQVEPLWDKIPKAFQTAFSASAKNIISAFNELKRKVLDNVKASAAPTAIVVGQTITYAGVKYNCKTEAKTLKGKLYTGYYPALIFNGVLYVDTAHSLAPNIAKAFLMLNSHNVGVMAATRDLALTIASPVKRDEIHHSGQPGYFNHIHATFAGNAHCWYLI